MSDEIDRLGGRGAEVEAFLTDWMRAASVPGASVAVVEDDDLVYARGFGARDLDENRPATPDTLYGIASCTKSFTALSVAQLAAAGDLSLDDPVSDYLPFDLGDDVTVVDLLTHTPGYPGDGMAVFLLMRLAGIDRNPVQLSDIDDALRFVNAARDERVASPGERFFYYNSGYTLLGEIVARVSGTPFSEYVRENVLAPLGMERSTFSRAEFEADDDAMTPYVLEDGEPTPSSIPFHPLVHPAGGLLSSVRELSRYLRTNMNGGALDGERVIPEESLAEMHAGHVDYHYGLSAAEGRYGYGWTRREFGDDALVCHLGDLRVSSAFVGFLEGAGVGVAVAANVSPDHLMSQVGEALLQVATGRDPRRSHPFFSIRSKYDRVAGTYRTYPQTHTDHRATIRREGGALRLESSGYPTLSIPLIPESDDPDDFGFYTVSEEGLRKPVEVDVRDDGVDVYVARWRFRKIE